MRNANKFKINLTEGSDEQSTYSKKKNMINFAYLKNIKLKVNLIKPNFSYIKTDFSRPLITEPNIKMNEKFVHDKNIFIKKYNLNPLKLVKTIKKLTNENLEVERLKSFVNQNKKKLENFDRKLKVEDKQKYFDLSDIKKMYELNINKQTKQTILKENLEKMVLKKKIGSIIVNKDVKLKEDIDFDDILQQWKSNNFNNSKFYLPTID